MAGQEAIITAGEREVRVLFTNRALAEVEGQLKRPIIAIAQGFADGTSGVTDVAHVLRAGMEAARRDAHQSGHPVTLNDAYAVMDELSFGEICEAVMLAVARVLSNGDGESDEEADPNA
jgi:hypothetical protein